MNKPFIQYERPDAPLMKGLERNKGKTPNQNHAKDVYCPDNKRAPFKSKVIFDK